MILVLPISLLPVLPYIVQNWLWVSFFLYLGDHFALWCITECKCQGAAWLQVFPLFCGHISSSSKRLGPLDFLSANNWAVALFFFFFFSGPPTIEEPYYLAFWNVVSGFWMLLTSACTTIIPSATHKMIELKKDLYIHTRKCTRSITWNTHAELSDMVEARALSADELSWSQNPRGSATVSALKDGLGSSITTLTLRHNVIRCVFVCVCVRVLCEERARLKGTGPYSATALCLLCVECGMFTPASCLQVQEVLEECALIETTGTAYTQPKQVSGGKKRLLPLWSIWLPSTNQPWIDGHISLPLQADAAVQHSVTHNERLINSFGARCLYNYFCAISHSVILTERD